VEEEPGRLEVRVTLDVDAGRAPGDPPPGSRSESSPWPPSREDSSRGAETIKADQAAFQKAWDTPFGPRISRTTDKPRDAVITAHFGDKRTLNDRKPTQHFGLDLDGSTGDEIRAPNAGRVLMVRDCYTWGTRCLEHGAD
jgi:murein DD-endopeptidase MepM/ murein hydrolase activator NlpD